MFVSHASWNKTQRFFYRVRHHKLWFLILLAFQYKWHHTNFQYKYGNHILGHLCILSLFFIFYTIRVLLGTPKTQPDFSKIIKICDKKMWWNVFYEKMFHNYWFFHENEVGSFKIFQKCLFGSKIQLLLLKLRDLLFSNHLCTVLEMKLLL